MINACIPQGHGGEDAKLVQDFVNMIKGKERAKRPEI